jgi:hypothetical protein
MVHVRDYLHVLLQFVEQEPRMLQFAEELSETSKNRWFITNADVYYKWGKWVKDDATGWEFSNDSWRYARTTTWYNKGTPAHTPLNPMLPAPKEPEKGGNKVFNDYYDANGDFHASEWRTDMAKKLGLIRSGNVPEQSKNAESYSDNLPSDDLFLYGLIGDDGQVIWDSVPDDQKTGVNTPDYLYCPDCFEDKHLMVSPYDIGDTLCCNCGAIFLDASGRIMKYDPDVQNTYLERIARRDANKIMGGE